MRIITNCALAALLLAAPTLNAQELVSQANSWGLSEEEPTALRATVVDIACELTTDCPENCGDGTRNLGLLDEAGQLITVAKNAQAQFNGPVVDLLPFCGQTVDADGLMTGFGGNKLFQIQFLRETGPEDWQAANNWTAAWQAASPDIAEGDEPWFRRDPRVLERIETNGYLGLGLEEDARFIADW